MTETQITPVSAVNTAFSIRLILVLLPLSDRLFVNSGVEYHQLIWFVASVFLSCCFLAIYKGLRDLGHFILKKTENLGEYLIGFSSRILVPIYTHIKNHCILSDKVQCMLSRLLKKTQLARHCYIKPFSNYDTLWRSDSRGWQLSHQQTLHKIFTIWLINL